MSNERTGTKLLIGEVLEEDDLVSLADLCRSCTVETQTVTTLVAKVFLILSATMSNTGGLLSAA